MGGEKIIWCREVFFTDLNEKNVSNNEVSDIDLGNFSSLDNLDE